VSSDLDAMYVIPDDPRGMLLEHWLIVQSVRQNASEIEYYILRATEELTDVTPGFQLILAGIGRCETMRSDHRSVQGIGT